jgi:hypothetical protein
MSTIDWAELRREIKAAARLVFDDYRRNVPEETFYAFALYTDSSSTSIEPAANTEEGYERCVQRYQANKSMMETYAKYNISWESCLANYRWGVPEWSYCGSKERHFGRASDFCDDESDEDESMEEIIDRITGIWASMVLGLADLDAEGYFGKGDARSRVTIYCTVNDCKAGNWVEYESARRLNRPEVFEAFWSQRTKDKVVAENFANHQCKSGIDYEAFMKHLQSG